MLRLFLLTLLFAAGLLLGFEFLRSLTWALELKFVLYLAFVSLLFAAYIRIVDRAGYLNDWH